MSKAVTKQNRLRVVVVMLFVNRSLGPRFPSQWRHAYHCTAGTSPDPQSKDI
jgi:hypothetical protein